jgi:hypothetical protein
MQKQVVAWVDVLALIEACAFSAPAVFAFKKVRKKHHP